jgi:hypothetical protein
MANAEVMIHVQLIALVFGVCMYGMLPEIWGPENAEQLQVPEHDTTAVPDPKTFSVLQELSQPSHITLLASSHCSVPATIPSPHTVVQELFSK